LGWTGSKGETITLAKKWGHPVELEKKKGSRLNQSNIKGASKAGKETPGGPNLVGQMRAHYPKRDLKRKKFNQKQRGEANGATPMPQGTSVQKRKGLKKHSSSVVSSDCVIA